jgi:hypothetical protein
VTAGSVADSFEHGNKSSGSTNVKFIYHMAIISLSRKTLCPGN